MLLLLEAWLPIICNFIEESDVKVALNNGSVDQIVWGTFLTPQPSFCWRNSSDDSVTGWSRKASLGKWPVRKATPAFLQSTFSAAAALHRRLTLLLFRFAWENRIANLLRAAACACSRRLIGREHSSDFPLTMKLLKVHGERGTAIWSQQHIPFLVKRWSTLKGSAPFLKTAGAFRPHPLPRGPRSPGL